MDLTAVIGARVAAGLANSESRCVTDAALVRLEVQAERAASALTGRRRLDLEG